LRLKTTSDLSDKQLQRLPTNNDKWLNDSVWNDLHTYVSEISCSESYHNLNLQYCDEDQYNENVRQISTLIDISIFHINIRSLNSKSTALCQYLESLNNTLDVIVLLEIWSCNIDCYAEILPDYSFYYDTPESTIVGGIGMFVNNTFQHWELHQYKIINSPVNKVENIWIQLNDATHQIIIGGVYRNPNQQLSDFIQLIDSTFSKISSGHIPCVIAGDFNIDMTKYATHTDTANYIDNLIMNDFMPTFIMPTHVSKPFCFGY